GVGDETRPVDLDVARHAIVTKEFVIVRCAAVRIGLEEILDDDRSLYMFVAPFALAFREVVTQPLIAERLQMIEIGRSIGCMNVDHAAAVISLHDEAAGELNFSYIGGVIDDSDLRYEDVASYSLADKLAAFQFAGEGGNKGSAIEKHAIENFFVQRAGPEEIGRVTVVSLKPSNQRHQHDRPTVPEPIVCPSEKCPLVRGGLRHLKISPV